MPLCHPRRMRPRRSRQAYFHPVCPHELHNLIQPCKIIRILIRLQRRPAKHIQRHNIDMRLRHQPHILLPYFSSPLLRVIVPAVQHICLFIIAAHFPSPFRKMPGSSSCIPAVRLSAVAFTCFCLIITKYAAVANVFLWRRKGIPYLSLIFQDKGMAREIPVPVTVHNIMIGHILPFLVFLICRPL